jgi:FAD/FMN-containing dehydrogenase
MAAESGADVYHGAPRCLRGLIILSQWTDPADSARNIEWTRAFFDAMQPLFDRGVYANNLGDEGEDRVQAAYGANYDRLLALKNKYDPTNLFSFNQNIRPTAQSGAAC